jgi:hypothetical protein
MMINMNSLHTFTSASDIQ